MKRYRIASVLFVVCILFSFTFSNGFAAEKKANPMDHFGFSEEDFQNGPDVKALIEKMALRCLVWVTAAYASASPIRGPVPAPLGFIALKSKPGCCNKG